MNVYKITTSFGSSQNWDSYVVVAENGVVASAWLNDHVLVKKRHKINEVVEEIELICAVDHIIQNTNPPKVRNKKHE